MRVAPPLSRCRATPSSKPAVVIERERREREKNTALRPLLLVPSARLATSVERKGEARQGAGGRNGQESELEGVSKIEFQKASQVEMGGALLSGGHQSSSPFIVGFAGVILAQDKRLRRARPIVKN